MINSDTIKEEIERLSFSSPGSGNGSLYHEIPFDEFENLSSARNSNNLRLQAMIKNYDFRGKKVLDIGCNVGYFCFKLAEHGADCYGIDYDGDSIKIAKLLQEYKSVENVNFFCNSFDENSIENILLKHGPFDVIILQSVIHWLMNSLHSTDRISSLIRKLSNNKQTIFYEPSIGSNAYYPELLNQHEIKKFLNRCGYSEILRIGRFYTSNTDTYREYWMGKIDFSEIASKLIKKKQLHGLQQFNTRYRNYFVKAISVENPALFTFKNEIQFSLKLREKSYLPYFFGSIYFNNYIFLFYEYVPAKQLNQRISFNVFKTLNNINLSEVMLIEKELFNILDDLKKESIVHRDIIPRNILYDKFSKSVYLIDFQLATEDGLEITTATVEETNMLKDLLNLCGNRGKYSIPNGLGFSFETDKYAVKKNPI